MISILVGFDGDKDCWFVEIEGKESFSSREYEESKAYSLGLLSAYNDCGVKVDYRDMSKDF